MMTDTSISYLVRSPSEKDAIKFLKSIKPDEGKKEPKSAQYIYCRKCFRIITSPDERMEVHGAHQHTFANPHGLVFEIGCFGTAEGCGYTGLPTTEFSWFNGFSWQIAICSRCLTHVGWLFTSTSAESFNGLIVDRLIYTQ